ncbi:recombinase family protein [Embleya sp. NPDC055664]
MTTLFAFAGRVSTEDQQDPDASRNWQLGRAQALIEPTGGRVVAEYFDIGESRSLPWKRRPRAAALLQALKEPDRGFDAVVIGEPQRAFYGNQYSLTHPVFVHYGVELWVPEVGGPIDPASEAHDMIMSVFGGMSKGERSRIQLRVRAAMAAQARIEGRFLGGRPPYGYRLVDAGPHPHPAKAAEGRRLHRLEPDPDTAPVVVWIFTEYLAGRGMYAIAEDLTRSEIPCPSAHDRARNPHRSGEAWSKSAVRAILTNPRYTGHQVWNRQRKHEVLIDVDDVALGHETRMRWNNPDDWVWSTALAHEPIIDIETFRRAQAILAGRGRARGTRERHTTRHCYQLRRRLRCAICRRRMQGQRSSGLLYYRCRFPKEYALAGRIDHPTNVYVAEQDLIPPLDAWLAEAFGPDNLTDTIDRMYAAQPDPTQALATKEATQVITDCDRKLTRYRAALEAGTDPGLIATWTAEVQATRAQALARTHTLTEGRRMERSEVEALVHEIGNIRAALAEAEPQLKADTYEALGLELTYDPTTQQVRAEASLDPHKLGLRSVSEGGLEPPSPFGH